METRTSAADNPSARLSGVQRGILGLAAGLLVLAILLQPFFHWRKAPHSLPPRLADSVTRSMEGWKADNVLLGPTEAGSKSVLKTLNFDAYVYRRFQNGAVEFTVYLAYWGPGKMPIRLVASHTPDRCWTESGMRCVEQQFRARFEVKGVALQPAEVRTFLSATGEEKIHVAYWHLVEGRIYDYGARFNAIPHPWLWWKDTLAQALYGSREQLFVRISSPLAFDVLWRDPGFLRVLEDLASLGLYEVRSGANR